MKALVGGSVSVRPYEPKFTDPIGFLVFLNSLLLLSFLLLFHKILQVVLIIVLWVSTGTG